MLAAELAQARRGSAKFAERMEVVFLRRNPLKVRGPVVSAIAVLVVNDAAILMAFAELESHQPMHGMASLSAEVNLQIPSGLRDEWL
jgi:hypothetical protein